jgi:ubiquinol-cytochrome c reductase cytochrome b subunit
MRRLIDWLENRTGIETAVRSFLYEDIPASAGWHQAFGSVAVFAFLMQVFTGILLAFNYAPTPGDAYNSLRYIVREVTGGSVIRGLHHWGASMMIVTVVLHMAQVFVWGAYKKPRETTWMVGVVLMLVTLAFGLTGYLLPWDNRAYWGTVVTTKIAAQAPIAGPYLARLLGGEGSIGVVTFARFYAMHVLILPPLTMLLTGLHVYLVRKHGVTPEPIETGRPRKFFPEQVFKDTTAIFLYVFVLAVLAAAVRVPLGRLADPTDTAFVPRPEWYFLFLFQTLKFFEGPLEVVGTVILPTLAILVLFLIPFVDRSRAVRVTKRIAAMAAVVFVGLGWGALTLAALRSTPASAESGEDTATTIQANAVSRPSPQTPLIGAEARRSVALAAQTWQQLLPEELAGIGYFRSEKCATCHSLTSSSAMRGPDLTRIPMRKTAKWMIDHFKRPSQLVPGTSMPAVQLTDAQLSALASFLLKLNPGNGAALQSAPQPVVEGAIIYQTNDCGSCHTIKGQGTEIGPALDGVASRHPREWIQAHFRDPAKMSPGSPMPAFNFNERDMERITNYLMGLPNL